MKCNHDVKSYEWQKCSKCGKYVRVNRKREIVGCVLIALFFLIVSPRIADFGIQRLHLGNPYNATYVLIELASFFLFSFFFWRIFPFHDEKEAK